MEEPIPAVDGPVDVTYMVRGCLQHSEAFLRISGHPGLLAVAEAVNGPDFTPQVDRREILRDDNLGDLGI